MGTEVLARKRVAWAPQPGPQHALLHCTIHEIFFGGARGGGKTDGMLGRLGRRVWRYGSNIRAIFFRRELTQLDAAIERAKQIYLPMGAAWKDQKKTFIFRSGAIAKFRPLESDADAEKYQGHEYTDVYFEELTNYPTPVAYNKMRATLRSAAGVPVHLCSTGNPGGPGHNWVKARFIDPAPSGWKVLKDLIELPDGRKNEVELIYIPSRVSDNQKLLVNDPYYEFRLGQTGSKELVRAWLNGDWSVIEGAYFDCWSERMVIRPVTLPEHWLRLQSFDWGSAAPFSVGWWAVVGEPWQHPDGQVIPAGAMVRYREWYGRKKDGTGLKMQSGDVARAIRAREVEQINYRVADPSVFISDDGPCIAENMQKGGVTFQAGDNRRIAGWDQMRGRMVGSEGVPMVYLFSTCVDSIRTIPTLQHDKQRMEDLDTDGEDHAADEWRYACMSRPWTAPKPTAIVTDINTKLTMNDLLGKRARKRA